MSGGPAFPPARLALPLVSPAGVPGARRLPIPEALAMILCAAGYLLLLTGFMILVGVTQLLEGTSIFPDRLMEVRDLVALFGWVGLTISGVSTIVVPNHLGVPLRPRALPRLHLGLTNAGIVGYLVCSLVETWSVWAPVFLMLAAGSYLLLGLALVRVLAPFARDAVRPAPTPGLPEGRRTSVR